MPHLSNREIIARSIRYLEHEYHDAIVFGDGTVTFNVTPEQWEEAFAQAPTDTLGMYRSMAPHYYDTADFAIQQWPFLGQVTDAEARKLERAWFR